LFAGQDRGDDVGGEEFQPHDPRCVRGGDIFLSGDLVETRTADFEQSLADFLRADQQPDQARIRRGGDRWAVDDEFHFLSGPL